MVKEERTELGGPGRDKRGKDGPGHLGGPGRGKGGKDRSGWTQTW